MTRLVWSDQAEADLAAIHAYIARDSQRYAQATIDRIIEAVERLREWPRSGRAVSEIGDDDLRELVEPPYRIVYRIEGETVGIATVVHSSREFRLPGGAV